MTLAPHETWHVQLSSGEVQPLSLDQLDEAFQAGVIDEYARVLAPGNVTWQTLAEAAGLGDDADEAPQAKDPFSDKTEISHPPTFDSISSFRTAVDGTVPVAAPSIPPSLAPVAYNPPSTVDLAAFDDDALDSNFKPKRGRAIGVAIGVVAAIAAVVLAVNLRTASADSTADVSMTNALGATPPSTETLPTPAPEPAAVAEVNVPSTPVSTLSEEQKKRLLEADKAVEDQLARAGHGTKAKPSKTKAAPKRRGGSKKAGISGGGGDKYDPLNGAL